MTGGTWQTMDGARESPGGPDPLEIIERRDARAELSGRKFEWMREKLRDGA